MGTFFALMAAIVWGGADFSGGLASRRHDPFQALALASSVGSLMLLAGMLAVGERLPPLASLTWAALGGLAGALGMARLYTGLAGGQAALVAPVAAVVGAALPVLFGIFSQGLPENVHLAGFSLAMPGIWLVSRPAVSSSDVSTGVPDAERSNRSLALGVQAGAGFAIFFICLAQVQPGSLFASMASARLAGLATALAFTWSRRLPVPGPRANPAAVLTGLLDPLGTAGYLLACQYTRLDVAVALSSLYPAVTVLLSQGLLKEKVAFSQWAGAALCLAATILISV